MPELTPQSTPPPVTPPPMIAPETWEDFQGFRESFLYHFPRPQDNTALRHLGRLLYELALETAGIMPDSGESATRTELRAAMGDLRHLEGFLTSVSQEHREASLSPEDARLSNLATAWAWDTRRIAERIATALAGGVDDGPPFAGAEG